LEKISDKLLQTLFDKLPEKERPKQLYFKGNHSLLQRRKIAIVGSRRASRYSKTQTQIIAKRFVDAGFVVVSGGAEGIDASAHEGAYPSTVAVMPCGLDIVYPEANRALIQKIYDNSLAVSEYEAVEMPRNYTFVHRNRLVVGMSEAVIIAEADEKSGSMHSAEYAIKYSIPLYVLSQRIDESRGTNNLVRDRAAKPIVDIDAFMESFGVLPLQSSQSVIVAFSQFYEKYGEKTYEMELEGKIEIKNGTVKILQLDI
jgi:DNA processing protein